MSTQQPKLPNRQIPFSEAFKAFICDAWAPYDETLPRPLPATAHTQARRDRLSALFPGERLVIPAGGLQVRSNDTDYRFRPHTGFAYLTGLGSDREPDAVLVLEPTDDGHHPTLYFSSRAPRTDEEFYADPRYGEMWVGQRESLAEMSAWTGLATAHIRDLPEALQPRLPTRVLRISADVTTLVDERRGGEDLAGDEELEVAVSEQRLTKEPFEIDQMRQACVATATGFEAVVRALPEAVRRGRGERWVEGVFALYARHAGNAVGYDTIAASGDHANTLHWIRNDGDLRDGDLLLLDAGVELDSLYTADVTRTLPVNGHFTPEQRQVYEAVLEAQRAGIAAARPGARFSDVHDAAVAVVARKLAEWGILPVSAEESLTVDGGQHRRWMVHGTSHHLGLDVHDCAQARREFYREGILRPGMVITVEPGIYLRANDLLVPQPLRGIGIRIEDDIVITEDGCEVLSHQIPTDPDELEAWMAPLLAS